MCRLLGYVGQPLALSRLLLDPPRSLVAQSLAAQEAKFSVNGDGFGLAWYGALEEPGIFKHTQPAWTDPNLRSLARHIHSGTILAHVRAATDGAITHTNCHPFSLGRFAFAHNGQIEGFGAVRRGLEQALPDELYSHRQGATDSELLFLLALAEGAEDDPVGALARVIERVAKMGAAFKFTALLSWDQGLAAVRYASRGLAPSLYLSRAMFKGGTVLASEPLTASADGWEAVPMGSVLVLRGEDLEAKTLSRPPVFAVTAPARSADDRRRCVLG